MIREIVADRLGRWAGDSDPQCFICQQPLAQEGATELKGEPVHRSCVRGAQTASRRASRGGRQ